MTHFLKEILFLVAFVALETYAIVLAFQRKKAGDVLAAIAGTVLVSIQIVQLMNEIELSLC